MKDTLTLTLDGHILAPVFSTVVQRYTKLVLALSTEFKVKDDVDWTLDGLIGAEAEAVEAGITYRGEADDPEMVERVVYAYGQVGKALEEHRPVPYAPAVALSACRRPRSRPRRRSGGCAMPRDPDFRSWDACCFTSYISRTSTVSRPSVCRTWMA